MAEDPRSTRELYDQSAAGWTRKQPSSVSDFTARPAVLALCQPIAGKRVLDLGCGEGYCARQLRAAGAGRVLGVDISSSMIESAVQQELREPLGIEYAQADAGELVELAGAEFDVVLAMFLFNYLTTERMTACMLEVMRLLAPGGRFVFAVPHPALPWMRRAEPPFYFDVRERRYFEARNARFAGKIWKRDGAQLDVQLVHKTVEDYFTSLREAGFERMPLLRELRVTPEISAVDPEFFAPPTEVPLHLAFAIER
jgi:toxoflavin synthase